MLKKLIACFATLVMCFALIPSTAHAITWDLWVLGTRVTSANAADVLGDGTVSFDESTGTLTLNGVVAAGLPEGCDQSALIESRLIDLTIWVKGDNVLQATSQPYGIRQEGDLTIIGSGTLVVSSGSSTSYSTAVDTGNDLILPSSFTGTLIAQGGPGGNRSSGIWADEFRMAAGTVIATGGASDRFSTGVSTSSSARLTGGTLIATGGDSMTRSYGVDCGQRLDMFSGSGTLVARAGFIDGYIGAYRDDVSFKAVSARNGISTSSSVKVAGKVGYDGHDLTTNVSDGDATGIAIVPYTWQSVDSVPATLAYNVYHVNTGATPFSSDLSSINLAGKTALFVDLYEQAGEATGQRCGLELTAENASISGSGTLVCVGGTQGCATAASAGLRSAAALTCSDAKVVAVGGPSCNVSAGINSASAEGGTLAASSGSVFGVGVTGLGTSIACENDSVGIDPAVTASGTARVVGVGGEATECDSTGIASISALGGTAKAIGVGGVSGVASSIGIGSCPSVADSAQAVAVGGMGVSSCGLSGPVEVGPDARLTAWGGSDDTYSSFGIDSPRDLVVKGEFLAAGPGMATWLFDRDDGHTAHSIEYEGVVLLGYGNVFGTDRPMVYQSGSLKAPSDKRICAHVMDSENITWTWKARAQGGFDAVASVSCKYDDGFSIDYPAAVDVEGTNPTCTEPGALVYTATAVIGGQTYTDTKEVASPATGHAWGPVSYTWSDDHSSLTATRTCETVAAHVETETVSATGEVTKPATCVAAGETTYTSAAFENPAFTAQVATVADVPVDPNAHVWGAATYRWISDNSACVATRVCEIDETHVETEVAPATSEVVGRFTVYTADFFGEAFETQTTRVPLGEVWTRLWGQIALDTMASIVQEGWADGGADTVIVATSGGFHDALAAASLAGAHNAPILLTRKAELSDQTLSEIRRLGASRAIIVGGPAAVSDDVENALKAELGDGAVDRVYGENAQLTAIEIADAAAEKTGSRPDTCIVATSKSYQDALAIAPYAYAKRVPIYLTNSKGQLRDDVAAQVGGYRHAVIVGGTAAVPQATQDQIEGMGLTTERLAGETALQTANGIAEWCVASQGMSADKMGVATAGGYHDALAGAALCGRNNSVMILVNKAGTNLYGIENFVTSHKNEIYAGYVFGGEAAVKAGVLDALEAVTA